MNNSCRAVCGAALLFASFVNPTHATEYMHPGVYVQESQSGVKPIEGVGTRTPSAPGSVQRTAPISPAAIVGPGMEAGTNRFGSDYHNVDTPNAQQCEAACASDAAQCKAWTWVKPGVQGPKAKCWLKNAVPAASPNDCCVSGVNAKAGGSAVLSAPLAPVPNQSSRSAISNDTSRVTSLEQPKPPVASAIPAPRLIAPQISGDGRQALPTAQPKLQGMSAMPVPQIPAHDLKAGSVPGASQRTSPADYAEAPAQREAFLPKSAPLLAPMRNKNMQAQQTQQRVMNNVRQQNALAASSYKTLLSEKGAENLVEMGVMKAEVIDINKQRPAGYVFRPGAAVAIHGRGMGTGGQLRLLGSFRTTPALIVNDWRPGVIYARIADDISGEEDLDDARLEIQPTGRDAVVVPGVRFEAAREVTLLKDIPQRYVTLPGQTAEFNTGGKRPSLHINSSNLSFVESVPAQSAVVTRETKGTPPTEWFAEGTDTYDLPLRPGFIIDSNVLWPGRSDVHPSKCGKSSGGQYFRGRYGVSLESENILKVNWGVSRCHISPKLIFDGFEWNFSAYGLDIYVVGPRGVSPFK